MTSILRHYKVHTIGVAKEVYRRNNSKAIFEDKMVQHFPKLMKATLHRFKSAVNGKLFSSIFLTKHEHMLGPFILYSNYSITFHYLNRIIYQCIFYVLEIRLCRQDHIIEIFTKDYITSHWTLLHHSIYQSCALQVRQTPTDF